MGISQPSAGCGPCHLSPWDPRVLAQNSMQRGPLGPSKDFSDSGHLGRAVLHSFCSFRMWLFDSVMDQKWSKRAEKWEQVGCDLFFHAVGSKAIIWQALHIKQRIEYIIYIYTYYDVKMLGVLSGNCVEQLLTFSRGRPPGVSKWGNGRHGATTDIWSNCEFAPKNAFWPYKSGTIDEWLSNENCYVFIDQRNGGKQLFHSAIRPSLTIC